MTPEEKRIEWEFRFDESVAISKDGKPGEPTSYERTNALNDADEWERRYNAAKKIAG